MLVLPESEKSRVLGFFPTSIPSRIWLDGYFESRVPGITYVDSLSKPTIAFVVTEFHHISFVGWLGQPTDFSNHLVSVLNQEVYLGLVWPESSSLDFPKSGLTGFFSRYEFRTYAPRSKLIQDVLGAEQSLTFLPIDGSNFSRCESQGECLYAYETKERFLQECFGLLAERNGVYVGNAEVICQSHGSGAGLRGDLQVVVSETYRKTGVGTMLAQKLIEQALSRGIQPTWSCNKDNTASEALARKLGFSDSVEFQIVNYGIEPGLQKYWVDILKAKDTRTDNSVRVVQELQLQYGFNRMDAHWLVVTYLRERENGEAEQQLILDTKLNEET